MGTEQRTFNDFFDGFPAPADDMKSGVVYDSVRTETTYRVSDPVPDITEQVIDAYDTEYDCIELYGEDEDDPLLEKADGNNGFYLSEGTIDMDDEIRIELKHRKLRDGDYHLHCGVEAPTKEDTYAVVTDVIKPAVTDYVTQKSEIIVEDIAERPDVGWEDIVLPGDVRERMEHDVLTPFFYPELRDTVGLDGVNGVMLEGEPGVGKTLLAKVVASEYDAEFYDVSASDLLTKWYGESNKNVGKLFEQIRDTDNQSIVFLDEADSLLRYRDGAHEATERVVNEFLGQMDGFEDTEDILFLGATNRYDALDPAAVRPGRFTECITIPEPDYEGRKDILKVHTRDGTFSDNINYDELARRTDGYVGADLKALADHARTAALPDMDMEALGEDEFKLLVQGITVTPDDFESALERMRDETDDPSGPMFQ